MKPSFRLLATPAGDLVARVEVPIARGVVLRGWAIRKDEGGRLSVVAPRVAVTQPGGILALEPGLVYDTDEQRQQWESRILEHYVTWARETPAPPPLPKPPVKVARGWTVQFDGGSRGNPGPAASGALVLRPGQEPLECFRYLGRRTNNVAEYTAVLIALEAIAQLPPAERPARVLFQGDSQLVVKQLSREWRIKDQNLAEIARKIESLIDQLDLNADFEWIPRERNSKADALVNLCLDRQEQE